MWFTILMAPPKLTLVKWYSLEAAPIESPHVILVILELWAFSLIQLRNAPISVHDGVIQTTNLTIWEHRHAHACLWRLCPHHLSFSVCAAAFSGQELLSCCHCYCHHHCLMYTCGLSKSKQHTETITCTCK